MKKKVKIKTFLAPLTGLPFAYCIIRFYESTDLFSTVILILLLFVYLPVLIVLKDKLK